MGLGRQLHLTPGKSNVDFAGADTAPVHPLQVNCYLRYTQPCRHVAEPGFRRSGRQESAEQHVAADSSGRIDNREAGLGHKAEIYAFRDALPVQPATPGVERDDCLAPVHDPGFAQLADGGEGCPTGGG
jgi:hypothetical protein